MGCRPGNCHRLGWLWRVPPKTIMPCDCASWRTISLGFGLSLRKDPILSQKMWTTIRMPLGIWCIHLYLQCLKLKPSSDLSGKPTGFNLLDPGWWKILSSAIGCHWCMMVPSLSSHHSIPSTMKNSRFSHGCIVQSTDGPRPNDTSRPLTTKFGRGRSEGGSRTTLLGSAGWTW